MNARLSQSKNHQSAIAIKHNNNDVYFDAGLNGKGLPLAQRLETDRIESYLMGLDLYVNDLSIKQDSGHHVSQSVFESAAKRRDAAEYLLGVNYN